LAIKFAPSTDAISISLIQAVQLNLRQRRSKMPGFIKFVTTYFPPPPGEPSCIQGLIRDWENHPSLIAGVEALDAYQKWVSSIVMPIAFAWIYEHYDDVYAKIPEKELHDDVGVVIAAAFELVRQTPKYQQGVQGFKKYKEDRKSGQLNTKDLNPIWTKITKEVRKATHGIFQAEKKHLDDTI
jgi:hypothetical protein